MKARTLISHQQYFGFEPVRLRTAATRVLARIVGLPPERARVSAQHVRTDFGLDTVQGQTLVTKLVEGGLLQPHLDRPGEFLVTPRFLEYATARVVEPLQRPRAKQLLDRACRLVEKINLEWSRNPLQIEALAVAGSYMSRSHELTDLTIGLVVRPRSKMRARPWSTTLTRGDGAKEIRAALQELSTFIVVHLVTRANELPRPFSIAWQAEEA